MKKTVVRGASLAIALLLGITSVACSGSEKEPEEEKPAVSATGTPSATPTGVPGDAQDGQTPDESAKWTFGQVAMGGGGFVTGVFSTSEQNLFYARTDVGGAYRYDAGQQQWVCLSYGISAQDKGLYGIEGLAVDPNAPNRVFLLAGTEYFSDGKTAIMYSEDYGETFRTVDVSDLIRVHGNGYGRQNGERIAVDPNNGDVIFAGGRTGGLIKSTDGGETWTHVESFPVQTTENGNGINGIVFDAASQGIYVSVSRKDAENVYYSADAGESWEAVQGLPTEYMPQRMKMDAQGNLYITYAAAEGPNASGGGGIYRINASDGSISDISPADKCFGDIVADANDPNRLVCCTVSVWSSQPNGSWGDEFYTSTDGGETWNCINSHMKMNNGGVEWVSGYAIHWCGSMAMDPFNADTVMVVSGNGIFRCDNIWAASPEFTFFVRGLEETVPLDCISIPGGTLFTAIGDYDGFDNTDVDAYGRLHTTAIGTTTSIAVAALNPNVRVKVGGNESSQKILYSEDGGETWTYMNTRPDPQVAAYAGCVTVTADGANIIWSTSNYMGAYITTDRGQTWEAVEGLRGGYYLAADPVNPNYVYASGANGLLVSSDGGKSFSATMMRTELTRKITVSFGNEGTIYIPCGKAGLFLTDDHAQTYARLDTVYSCEAVGLGKGRTDDAPYVIYIWGSPQEGDAEGIYLSEDEGATWVRVNNDAHQFGGPGNGNFLVGDYNVYGRCYLATTGLGLVYCDKTEK